MEFLHIGDDDWTSHLNLAEDVSWYHTTADELSGFLEQLKCDKFAILSEKNEEGDAKVNLRFDGVFLTSSTTEEALAPIMDMVESSAVFYESSIEIFNQAPDGFVRRKRPQAVQLKETWEETIAFISKIAFPSQYGARLKIPDIDINPNFSGQISYTGHVSVNFDGDFGQGDTPLYTYRYNLSSFPHALELWQEYQKTGDCHVGIEILPIRKGSLYDIMEAIILDEAEMQEPYVLASNPEVGFYTVSVYAKGKGRLQFGPLHWRYSREGFGRFVLGGNRIADSLRQEVITYFNPGDLKPPMTVYFSGFRTAEGFEGFGIMKSLKTPFMLIGDPRLEGGGFYSGSSELEEAIEAEIQKALDYLGFDGSQLILSGLSMGTYGALYYASRFDPHAVIVGKPFTNLGDTAEGVTLRRPYAFETAGDVLLNTMGNSQQASIDQLNHRFWKKFTKSNFAKTQFAIAYMEQDDYDNHATERLLEQLAETDSHIYVKGYEGRHNDNSPAINRWFMRQYVNLLE